MKRERHRLAGIGAQVERGVLPVNACIRVGDALQAHRCPSGGRDFHIQRVPRVIALLGAHLPPKGENQRLAGRQRHILSQPIIGAIVAGQKCPPLTGARQRLAEYGIAAGRSGRPAGRAFLEAAIGNLIGAGRRSGPLRCSRQDRIQAQRRKQRNHDQVSHGVITPVKIA